MAQVKQLVGLIGVGAMGAALLTRLKLAGCEVQAFDLSEARLKAAQEAGAYAAASIGDATRDADVIHVFVKTDEDVGHVMEGPDGVIAHAKRGALVLLHPTIMPETTRRIGDVARGQGIRVMDVPVTSVPRVVEAGEAVYLMGGSEEDAVLARSHLEGLGRAVHYFGPLGAGNVAKIAKNLINVNERIALGEALTIASAGGVDLAQFIEMSKSVDQGSALMRLERAFAIEGNRPVARPSTNLYDKDVVLAAALSRGLGVDAPMTQAAARTAETWMVNWTKKGVKA